MFGITKIINHNFREFKAGQVGSISGRKVFFFALLPLLLAVVWFWLQHSTNVRAISDYLIIIAMVEFILTAMLGLMIMQMTIEFPLPKQRNKPYEPVELPKFQKVSAQLTTLRELCANISYLVMLVIVALPMLLAIQADPYWFFFGDIIRLFIYFVCTTLAISFFDIISGIYLVLNEYGQHLSDELERFRPKDDEEEDISNTMSK